MIYHVRSSSDSDVDAWRSCFVLCFEGLRVMSQLGTCKYYSLLLLERECGVFAAISQYTSVCYIRYETQVQRFQGCTDTIKSVCVCHMA